MKAIRNDDSVQECLGVWGNKEKTLSNAKRSGLIKKKKKKKHSWYHGRTYHNLYIFLFIINLYRYTNHIT